MSCKNALSMPLSGVRPLTLPYRARRNLFPSQPRRSPSEDTQIAKCSMRELTFHHRCVSGSSPIFAMSVLKSSSDVLLMYRICATRRWVVCAGEAVAVEGTRGSSK